MSFNRVVLGLHVAALLIVIAAWLVMMNMEPNTFCSISPPYERVAIVRGAFTFVAALSGFWSMAARPPRKESVSLAISTVAAVLLLLLG